jgi:hypothetical protein
VSAALPPPDLSAEFGDSSPDDVEETDPHLAGWQPPVPDAAGLDSTDYPWEDGAEAHSCYVELDPAQVA